MNNMSLDDMFKTADANEAKGDFAAAISIYREILKNEPAVPQRLKALDGLARTLFNSKDLDGAQEAFTNLYEFLKNTFGPEHKNTGLGLNHLIRVASAKNDTARAIDLGKQAVEIFKKAAEDAPDDKKTAAKHQLATVYFTLALNCYNSENYDGAEEALQAALALWKEIEGPKGQNVANVYNNLGRVYEQREQRDQGIGYHQKAVAIRKEVLGEHKDTAFSLGNLGTAYAENNQFKEAVDALSQSVAMYDKLGLGDTPGANSYRQNLEHSRKALEENGE